MQKDTRAGSMETLVKELAAMPTGAPPDLGADGDHTAREGAEGGAQHVATELLAAGR